MRMICDRTFGEGTTPHVDCRSWAVRIYNGPRRLGGNGFYH
jgi:hypothetical protein